MNGTAYSDFSARKRTVQACGFYWKALGGGTLLLGAARLDLPFARLDDAYTVRRWQASSLEDFWPQFGEGFL